MEVEVETELKEGRMCQTKVQSKTLTVEVKVKVEVEVQIWRADGPEGQLGPAVPVKRDGVAVFVPEDEQDVIAGHRRPQVAAQLGRRGHHGLQVHQRNYNNNNNNNNNIIIVYANQPVQPRVYANDDDSDRRVLFFFCYFILSVVIIEEPYANEPPAAGSSSSRVCKTTLPNDMQMRDAAVVAGFSISARLCRFTTATGDGDDADYKPTDNR